MAHNPAATRRLEQFLIGVVVMQQPALAHQYFQLTEQLADIDDDSAREAAQALINAVDAIGFAKFPSDWVRARDSAGVDQSVPA